MLHAAVLSVILVNGVMLSVIMLSVMAPSQGLAKEISQTPQLMRHIGRVSIMF
jgi:hypothetical protein